VRRQASFQGVGSGVDAPAVRKDLFEGSPSQNQGPPTRQATHRDLPGTAGRGVGTRPSLPSRAGWAMERKGVGVGRAPIAPTRTRFPRGSLLDPPWHLRAYSTVPRNGRWAPNPGRWPTGSRLEREPLPPFRHAVLPGHSACRREDPPSTGEFPLATPMLPPRP